VSSLNFNDADAIKRTIVDPVVDGVEARLGARIAALETSDNRQQADIDALKKNQGRALIGMSALVLFGTAVFNAAWDKFKRALGWH
jgi:hypothetical protein